MKASIGNWRNWLAVVAFGAVAAWVAAPATAVPIFDGNYDGLDVYDVRLEDDNGEADFGGDSWDIDGVGFAFDATWLYMGLDTVGAFDRNGGDGAFPAQTVFLFQNTDATPDSFFFILTVDDATEDLILVGNGLTDDDWDVVIGTDLELRIKLSEMPGLDMGFSFIGRLDNSAMAPDDVVVGVGIPEPAALSVLALGSLAVLFRRRRK